jgi:hypothetical protein
MADIPTIAGALGVGLAAFGATLAAAWPIIKKVREVVPPTPPAQVQQVQQQQAQLQQQFSPTQSSPALPAFYQCAGCTYLSERVNGLEDRERENNALLHEIIGRMKGNGTNGGK